LRREGRCKPELVGRRIVHMKNPLGKDDGRSDRRPQITAGA
jgi:hypothetical protein